MKINEVITEGIGDVAKSAWSGAKRFGHGVAGAYQAVKQNQAMRAAAAPGNVADKANLQVIIGQWANLAKQLSSTENMTDPAVYKSQLEKWATARYPSASKIDATQVDPRNPATVTDYITKMYNSAMANRQMRQPGTETPSQISTPTIPNQGSVFLVKSPTDQYYFKSYNNKWYTKDTIPTHYSLSDEITDPKSVSILNSLLPDAKTVFVKQDPTDNTGVSWLEDPRATQRAVLRKHKTRGAI